MVILKNKSNSVPPLLKILTGISITYRKGFKSVLWPLSLAWSGPGCLLIFLFFFSPRGSPDLTGLLAPFLPEVLAFALPSACDALSWLLAHLPPFHHSSLNSNGHSWAWPSPV